MMNWIFWAIPEQYIRRYFLYLALILFFIPNYIFGIYYTVLGFVVNYLWFDLVFYGWVKFKDKLEGLEEITEKNKSNFDSPPKTTTFLNELKSLQLIGRDRPLNRQVGAWQSNKITPHSVLKSAMTVSYTHLTLPTSDLV